MMRKIKPKSHKEMTDTPQASSPDKKIYPIFRIGLEHLPEAKKWKIGSEYTITLKVKQTGISISRFQNDAEFDIIGIDPKKEENPHNKEYK